MKKYINFNTEKRKNAINDFEIDFFKLMFNDFSNYSKNSKFFDDANKKVIGRMKDEYGIVFIDKFVGLKSKMYKDVLLKD